jgi:peptidoglycan/xylan/chitin deacetylase (PgdA/CDA1 family)
MRRPTPPRRGNLRRLRAASCLVVAAVLAQGCVETPPRPPTVPAPAIQREAGPLLGRDDDFAVVVALAGDDFATLAERYVGDRGKGWWIAEFNGIDAIRPGQTVVIPLRLPNRIGVHWTAFQTIPILCYHRFGSRSSQLTVAPAAFEAQMEYLARNGYHVVPLARLTGFLDGKEALPRKTVVVTIDDGYRSTYDIAYPILKKHGFPATVFLYSDFVGATDALTWSQMKEMADSGLIDIQPHSKSHANLALRLPEETDAKYRERVRREVDAPISVIQERLGIHSTVYAFPYGDVTDTVLDQLKRQGVRLAVTVTPGGNGFFAPPQILRRSMVFGNDSLDVFKSKLVTSMPVTPR